ncbi:MAG TPA: lysophospholipid acyltransferase family protein [Myxococcales bacterium]|nr:lysophospholipid acyltransferase family protein [Myxococcales bacterium]
MVRWRERVTSAALRLRSWAVARAGPDFEERFGRAVPSLNEFGVDRFGYSLAFSLWLVAPLLWLYRWYFRVECRGLENLPARGPVILVANHSGQIPLDAGMIALATILEAPSPRAVRGMTEKWISGLPWASTVMSRSGMVVGTPENCRRLLRSGEPVLVFPEGVRGIVKAWRRRYQLQEFGQGFMRLALETGAPIVPVAVIGGEEQMPAIAELPAVGRLLGLSTFPLVVFPLPLPTKYRLHFGAPLRFGGTEDEGAVEWNVEEVKRRLQTMIDDGLRSRAHVFW